MYVRCKYFYKETCKIMVATYYLQTQTEHSRISSVIFLKKTKVHSRGRKGSKSTSKSNAKETGDKEITTMTETKNTRSKHRTTIST